LPTENSARLARTPSPARRAEPAPLYAVWEITLACDLGCRHCGSRAGPRRDTELTTAECLDVVAQMRDLGFREVTLIGGEAYLREDWDVIARAITDAGMVCGITTGGRAFTDERVARAVDAGVSAISVSIDGLERTHDAQRGVRGAFASALDAARRIAASPIRLSFNTQINRLSLPELPALATLAVETGAEAWQIQLTVPMGRGADRPGLILQPYELIELFPLLAWLKANRLEPAGVQVFPGNNIGYFGPWESLLRYGGRNGAHWNGCGAGKWCMGFEADGKIKACPSLPSDQYTGGYLQSDRLGEVIAGAVEVTHLRNRTRDDLWGYCASCHYADVCKAGCTWTSHCILGRAGNNPYCIHRALEFEARGERERLVFRDAAPGRPFDFGRYDLVVEPLPAETPPADTLAGRNLATLLALPPSSPGLWSEAELRGVLASARSGRELPVLAETE
jgi:radical SAM protein with 4Fe4S-binding SPASM domain